jgi:hypothetical protein
MTTYLDNFARAVDQMLDEAPASANDLVSLAISGEQLRRGSALAESVSDEARRSLERYDAFLEIANNLDWPAELSVDLSGALEDLRAYAGEKRRLRDIERGEQYLVDVDHVLSIAAAETRAGHRSLEQLADLAAPARPDLAALAPELLDLAQVAEDRRLLFGRDPDYIDLFDFYEELARFAPSRVALESAVVRKATKQRLIDAAIADFYKPGLLDRVRELASRVKELFTLPIPATLTPVASFDTDPGVPELRQLASFDGLDVFTDGVFIHLVVEAGHRIKPVDAILEPKADAGIESFGDDAIRLPIPREPSTLRLTVEIDGERIELPPIHLTAAE